MPIIILIPTVICIVALFRDSVQRAFINVYLPIFMLFPVYYFWKVASLPPIDLSEAALLPLGMAILIKEMPSWRISRMDLWMGIFVFSSCYADSFRRHDVTSTFELFSSLCIALVPYAAGKLLIESNGMRVAVIKRIVFCQFIASLISVYEYRMGQNPFTLAFARFFPNELFAWKTQLRWGFGRISGPYGQSELAGMMLFFGLILTLWLGFNHEWEPKFKSLPDLPLKKSTLIAWTLGFTLLMTQARGPWLGAMLAVPVAMVGRAKHVLRASILTALVVIVGGSLSYGALKHYADGPQTSAEQQTAQYRSQLLVNYMPVAKAGGPWGWGSHFPQVGGQGSIDNEYLYLALTQGWVGLAAFCLLALEAFVSLVMAAIEHPRKRDRHFAFSLMGVLLGMMLTVFTVFLGNQPFELFFLLIGWSQALRLQKQEAPKPAFQQVYS